MDESRNIIKNENKKLLVKLVNILNTSDETNQTEVLEKIIKSSIDAGKNTMCKLGEMSDSKQTENGCIVSFTEISKKYTLFLPGKKRMNLLLELRNNHPGPQRDEMTNIVKQMYPDGKFLVLGSCRRQDKFTIIILRNVDIIEKAKNLLKLENKNCNINKIIFTDETKKPHVTLDSTLFSPKTTFKFINDVWNNYPSTFKI